MNKKRQKQIEEIASTLLRKMGCYPAHVDELIDEVGIPVDKIATQLGIALVPYDFGEDVSGVLLRDGLNAQIGYAVQNSIKRQRFTIAHELGHYVLDHRRQGVFVDTVEKYMTLFRDSNSSTGENVQEREANAFAAALLMPRDLVSQAIKAVSSADISREENYNLIGPLALRFNVSELAMSYRLTNLDQVW